jgi:hypothetical protein
VYLWIPMVTWSLGLVRLARMLIYWRARIGYERTRAASIADLLRVVPVGATVRDCHADGSVLWIEIPARQEPRRRGVHELPGRSLAERR